MHGPGLQQHAQLRHWRDSRPVRTPVDPDAPSARLIQACDQPHRGRFARPVRAEEARHHPRLHHEVQAVNRELVTVTLAEILDLYHRRPLAGRWFTGYPGSDITHARAATQATASAVWPDIDPPGSTKGLARGRRQSVPGLILADQPGNATVRRTQAPLMSLSESGTTCHSPSRPLPLVVSTFAPAKVYSGRAPQVICPTP